MTLVKRKLKYYWGYKMFLQYLIIKDEKTAKIKDFNPESELVRMNCEELKVLKIKRSFYIRKLI